MPYLICSSWNISIISISRMGCAESNLYKINSKVLLNVEQVRTLITQQKYLQVEQIGNCLFEEGNYQQAIIVYQNIIENNLSYDYEAVGLGNVELDSGMLPCSNYQTYMEAIKHKKIIQNPHDALSLCYASLGKTKKSILKQGLLWYEGQLQKVENYQIYMGYANLLSNIFFFDEAISSYKKAIGLKPSLANAYASIIFIRQFHRINQSELASSMQKLAEIDPSNMYQRFIYAKNKQKNEERLLALTILSNQFPDYARIINEIGIYYSSIKEYQNAISQYQKCIKLSPSYAVPYYNIGMCYVMKENNKQAISKYMLACCYKPDFSEAYTNLVKLFDLLNYSDEKIAGETTRYNKLDYYSFFYHLGIAYYESGQIKNSIKWFKEALKINDQSYQVFNSLAVVEEESLCLEADNKCLTYYNQCIKYNPNYQLVYYNLAIYYKKKNKIDKVIQLYKKALQINPKFSEAYNNLGNIYKEKSLYQDAIRCYKSAIEYNSTLTLAHTNLMICQLLNMGTKRAFVSFLKAKQQLPFDKHKLSEKSRTYIIKNLQKCNEKWKGANMAARKSEPIYKEQPCLVMNEDDHGKLNYLSFPTSSLQPKFFSLQRKAKK